jgi:FkbM family methyltransferase
MELSAVTYHFIFVTPKKLLGRSYFFYLKFIYFLLSLTKKSQISISKDAIPGVYRVMANSTSIYVQDAYRSLRVTRGLTAAGERLWVQHYKAADFFDITEIKLLIDVGANIGEISHYFSQLGKQCLAFEPDPICFLCLDKNLDKSVELRNLALSDKSEKMNLYLGTETADTSLINTSSQSLEVITSTLDEELRHLKRELLAHSLLKIDAEGWEPEVLAGGLQVLPQIGNVLIDAGAERCGLTTFEACKEILENCGFMVSVRQPEGLVYARNLWFSKA